MLRLPVAVLLVLACAGREGGGQSAGSQVPSPASPTLKETTQWIEAHLAGLSHGSRKTTVQFKAKKGKPAKEASRQATNTHEAVSVVSFDGCTLTLGQLLRGDDYSIVTVSIVPLDRLTQASSKVEQFDPVKTENGEDSSETTITPASDVVITLEGSTKVITWKRRSTGSVPLEQDSLPFEGNSASLEIRSDDEAMPPRLVRAFNHAIKLCNANVKPEPF